MILNKKGHYYNFLGVEDDGLELHLVLEYWFREKGDGKIKHAKRTITVYSWEQLLEHMKLYEERDLGVIDSSNARQILGDE